MIVNFFEVQPTLGQNETARPFPWELAPQCKVIGYELVYEYLASKTLIKSGISKKQAKHHLSIQQKVLTCQFKSEIPWDTVVLFACDFWQGSKIRCNPAGMRTNE